MVNLKSDENIELKGIMGKKQSFSINYILKNPRWIWTSPSSPNPHGGTIPLTFPPASTRRPSPLWPPPPRRRPLRHPPRRRRRPQHGRRPRRRRRLGSNAAVPAWLFQDGWVNQYEQIGIPTVSLVIISIPILAFPNQGFHFQSFLFFFGKSHHTSTTSHHSDVWGLDTWAMKIHAILLDWRMNNAFRCDSVVIIPTTKQFIHLHKSSNQFVLSQLNLLQLPSRKLR